MKHELWYSVVVRDRNGKVLSRERRRSRSFLKQWNQLVYVHMAQAALTIKDTGGTNRSVTVAETDFAMDAAANNANYGIRVGTGSTPVDVSDYKMNTPIAEGGGAGQMNHLVCTVTSPTVAAPSCYFVVSRVIVNNSGGLITVTEGGVYSQMGPTPYYCCLTRDVFAASQDVPDGGSITINWTLQVTL